jgi:hypothetical protein
MNLISRKISVVIIFITLIFNTVKSADIKYKVSDIPAKLLTDAKAVVRKKDMIFEINDINKAVMKVTYVITVLNENGINNSILTEYYDRFVTVGKIQSKLYDKNGIQIKNGANVKVEDFSANIGYSLYEDNRVKVLDPKYRIIPFTVEYTFEISFNGLFYYPEWSVYDDYNISVETSSLTMITSNGLKLRYLEKNITDKCVISEEKGKLNYAWKFENMAAIKSEPFGTSFKEYTPVVYSAPSDFEIAGYKGNMETWSNYGKWISILESGRNSLEPESEEKIRNLVSGIKNDYDKIKTLYNYLQNKVRYVSVQKGIGGWQTIEAKKVDRVSYGDCKALSNYMKSLLDVVGIQSYYTLIGAGEFTPLINADFPSNQFNHAILCIPLNNDTIWLECTSQTIPFGYIGTFTDDRNALVTGDNGGKLVKTKKYSINDNKQIRNAVIKINPDGNAMSTVRTEYRGLLYDNVYPVLQLDEIDQRKFVQAHLLIPSYSLISYSYLEEKGIIPAIHEVLNLRLNNFGTFIGNKIIFKPNLMTRLEKLPYRMKERKSEIRIRRAYSDIDTIKLVLPKGYKIDQIPEKEVLISKFGKYSTETSYDDNEIRYIRKFSIPNGNYPVEDYPEFADFFEKISVLDESKIVICKII